MRKTQTKRRRSTLYFLEQLFYTNYKSKDTNTLSLPILIRVENRTMHLETKGPVLKSQLRVEEASDLLASLKRSGDTSV